MVSRVQSHIFGQFPQAFPDLPENLRHWRDVVDVGRFHMDIHNHIVLAIHCPMFAVVESIRLPVPALLSALRVCCALHPFRCAAPAAFPAFFVVIIAVVTLPVFLILTSVERLLAQYLPIQVHLLLQFFQIRFRCLLHSYQFLFMLIRFCLYMGRIGVQNRSSHQPLGYTLSQYLVEYLLRYIVVPEPPSPILTDRRRVRRFLCQPQAAKPFIRHIVVDLFFQPCFRLDPIQVSHQQHPKQHLRFNGRSSVI